ncbi:MAG TPA: hypothetical protein VGL44_07795 [Gaiellales bacterium]
MSAAAARPGDSFPELVWAHHRWQSDLHAADTLHVPSEAGFRETLQAFEARHGEIVNAYWCQHEASAVAITRKDRPGRARGVEMRFHSATHWATQNTPEVADVLHDCDSLAIRISEILRGASELIGLQLLLACAGHLLAAADYVERPPSQRERTALARRQKAELGTVAAYYRRAGAQAGRMVYVGGMVRGGVLCALLAALAVTVAVAFTNLSFHNPGVEQFLAVCTAGAVGAIVSVLSRMASPRPEAFSLDFEVGRKSIRWLGAFRPLTGTVFALFAYFALRSELLTVPVPANGKAIYFYIVVAFSAGFSERWAKVMMSSAEQKIAPGLHTSAAPEPDQVPAARAVAADAE